MIEPLRQVQVVITATSNFIISVNCISLICLSTPPVNSFADTSIALYSITPLSDMSIASSHRMILKVDRPNYLLDG
jgi:hypothetical protein